MAKCPACLAEESYEELVDEVFQIDGRYVLVSGAPSKLSAVRLWRGYAR
jgi:hypothetical protein